MKERKTLFYAFLIALLYACNNTNGIHETPRMQTAIFAYMLADNDLELFALRDINEMERGVASITKRNNASYVAAYMDKKNTHPQHGVVFEIQAETSMAIPSPIVRAYPENNSADPQVFVSVLTELMTRYPADNYILMVWSHGTGWVSERYTSVEGQKKHPTKSFGRDDSSHGAEMSIVKLANALRRLPVRLRVLMFDACYMGDVEVAYELKDVVDYVVFSQAEIQHDGFPYDTVLPLLADGGIDIEARLVKSVKAYYEYYNALAGARKTATLSLVKTVKLGALARTVQAYVAKHSIAPLVQAEKSAQKFSKPPHLAAPRSDMGDVFAHVPSSDESRAVVRALDAAVIASYNTKEIFNAIALTGVHGMSMYVPEDMHKNKATLRSYYKTLQWGKDSGVGDAWH